MNSFFQFKQFTVHQDKCAMKVCTDACLLGAWVANKLMRENTEAKKILDIGAGTGLLSLMIAQKTNLKTDAVELNADAYLQAKRNIENSLFSSKIQIYNENIKTFLENIQYDYIICNPPFFENQLKSNSNAKNIAMHNTELSFDELIASIKKYLSKNGTAFLLLPFYEVNNFKDKLSVQRLFVTEELNVKHTSSSNFFRTMISICLNKKTSYR